MAKKPSKYKKHSSVNYSKIKVVTFLKFLALILPLITYVIITAFAFPSPNSGFIFLGIIGSIIFGLGLVNIVGYIDDSNLGVEISGVTLGLGGVMMGISSVIMYTPSIYEQINEQQVSFYFLVWTVILVSMLHYSFFRGAMNRYMRSQGVSKSRISDLLKGSANFWLYKAANDSLNLKWMYHVNRLYMFSLLLSGTLHLLFGWSKFFAPIVAAVTVIALSFNVPMWSLVISTWNQSSSNRNSGFLLLYAGYLFPVGAIVATLMFTIKAFIS